jgi:UDP-galactopyranose mutase
MQHDDNAPQYSLPAYYKNSPTISTMRFFKMHGFKIVGQLNKTTIICELPTGWRMGKTPKYIFCLYNAQNKLVAKYNSLADGLQVV